MKKKLSKLDWICIGFAVGGFACDWLLPATGKLVLLGEICKDIAVLALFVWLLKETVRTWRVAGWKKRIVHIVLTITVLGGSLMLAKNTVLDIVNGSTTLRLTNCSVENSRTSRGIISLRYYLEGTDEDGQKYKFMISGADYEALKRQDIVTITAYIHTKRIISCQ